MQAQHQTEQNSEMERLLEFLYVAPVALIEFDDQGFLKMANPRLAQLFNRFTPGGYFENFFVFLQDFLPELEAEIKGFTPQQGQIMENKRFHFEVPNGDQGEIMWMDITIMRQEPQRYIASLNNVTEQVNAAKQSHLRGQHLDAIITNVEYHVIFTLDAQGHIDSWNRSGELATGREAWKAIGCRLSEIVSLLNEEESTLLARCQKNGWLTVAIQYRNAQGEDEHADMMLSVMNGLNEELAGYSAIICRHSVNH